MFIHKSRALEGHIHKKSNIIMIVAKIMDDEIRGMN